MNAALLINLLGFFVGTALYAMIPVMVVRHGSSRRATEGLLLTTAGLGLLWNLGELYVFVQNDFADTPGSPMLAALSFAALGFLPSVVVHSARSDRGGRSLNHRSVHA